MLDVIKVRTSQGRQYIPDLRAAVPAGFRGLPVVAPGACQPSCSACAEACATQAISLQPVRLDLGRCVFCTDCVAACGPGRITFTEEPRMAAADRAALL
ncbi:MAG: hydrogenase, partial [Anaeromyxobacteraceae bacterium]